VIVTAD